MPARKRRLYRKKNKKSFNLKHTKALFALFALLLFTAYLFFGTKYWDGKSKLSIVAPDYNGDVQILMFDPLVEEIVNITIPKDTQVEVSRQLGTWNIGSVWELGENEGVDGLLLAETATRYLKFPTSAWADSKVLLIESSNFLSLFRAAITPYRTNLKIGDRIRIALFSLRVKNTKRVSINLAETRYLKRTVLVGGEEGYVKLGSIPENIAAIFSDESISKGMVRVKIINVSGDNNLPKEVSEVIEVMGAKVVAIEKKDEEDIDCTIVGKKGEVNEKMQRIFGCLVSDKLSKGSSDIVITIGKEFARRY